MEGVGYLECVLKEVSISALLPTLLSLFLLLGCHELSFTTHSLSCCITLPLAQKSLKWYSKINEPPFPPPSHKCRDYKKLSYVFKKISDLKLNSGMDVGLSKSTQYGHKYATK